MIKNLSLRLKLMLAFLLLAVLMSGVSLYQVISMKQFNSLVVEMIDKEFGQLDKLNELKASGASLRAKLLQYQYAITDGASQPQPSAKTELSNATDALHQNLQQYLTQVKDGLSSDQITALSQTGNSLMDNARAILDASNATKQTRVSLNIGLNAAADGFDQTINQAIAAEHQLIAAKQKDINATVTQPIIVMLSGAGIVSAFAILVGVTLSTRITKELSMLKEAAVRIANGDLSQGVKIRSKDEVGQVATAFSTMATRLRDSYRRLAVETERDRTLLESLGEGVVSVDDKGRVELINDLALEILDLSDRDKTLGNTIVKAAEFYTEQDKPLAKGGMPDELAITSKKPSSALLGFHKKSGAKILLNVSANPVVVDENIVGAIMTLRDVTKEHEIDRMKTEFISLASHQLRTPLSAIKWFSEMLVSGDAGELQPDQLDFAKNISESTERMISLVNALLNISRIESGRIIIDPKPTDLGELIEGIINDLKAKTEEKKQTFVVSVHQDLPKINLDPRLISQVYLNLLTNAMKYTPKGGEISVFISKKGQEVISQVTDNGYGIPKEQQGRIFQKFFRASNAVKVETDGTGLGLYLIKAVVESSGGKIWFESEEGKGTTFWFSLPLSGMKKKEGEVSLDA